MLDVRTLFVVMIASSLLLAGSMAVAVGFKFRDGVGKWTGSLVLQALMFVLFGLRGSWPDFASVLLANALFVLVMSLQASAILEFFGQRMAVWWHLVPPILVIVLFSMMMENLTGRIIISGVIYGLIMLAIALTVQRLHSGENHPARWMLISGYLLGSAVLFSRTFAVLFEPNVIKSFLTPSAFQGLNFLAAYAVILITSVGFLLLHKERAEEAAQHLALTDPLTGTFNRRTFLQLADKEIARAERSRSPLALIMLDLDNFKKVNDTFGHQAGDMVLKRVVEVLLTCLRREDLLVRYGGEEFCILLPNVALDQATLMAERAREAVEKARFDHAGKFIPVTISLGIAGLLRSGHDSIERLVGRADEALYSAKRGGRNRVVAYPESSTLAMVMRSQNA